MTISKMGNQTNASPVFRYAAFLLAFSAEMLDFTNKNTRITIKIKFQTNSKSCNMWGTALLRNESFFV